MEPYRVPFTFDRSRAPRYLLVNRGAEPLRGVSATLHGGGLMPAGPPRPLRPGEHLELLIRGDDLARETTLVIRWLRPNGEEYLWRLAF
ncbi:PilZ domain-containing protein [Protaetiibacter larvae]|uniref:PilZ domain-containing protein n=1 Tax=Protaetiibacter larvae TaxID=2592654 RepID=A0A5C1Y9L1_9MICO|nr:PilZ domain-containing protein [Protaetiibacter larvae]QEO10486.1 PilZ domain-containing protein [Protaetiibacter larvae]